jgi:hypothetical protein
MISKRNSLLLPMLFSSLIYPCGETKAQDSAPPATTIPVIFTKTVDVANAHTGDPVIAKTMQEVKLPDGTSLPKGSTVRGHIVEVRAFSFDATPYAVQQPSVLSIHFDQILSKDGAKAINASVRALASRLTAEEASSPHRTDETDSVGTMVLIGGGSFNPLSKEVLTDAGDIIGYNRKGGVFARLLPAEYQSPYSHFECKGSGGEQSVAIFSPVACGVYGFDSVYMAQNGSGERPGTFRLESRHRSVKVYAYSAALLELTGLSDHGNSDL